MEPSADPRPGPRRALAIQGTEGPGDPSAVLEGRAQPEAAPRPSGVEPDGAARPGETSSGATRDDRSREPRGGSHGGAERRDGSGDPRTPASEPTTTLRDASLAAALDPAPAPLAHDTASAPPDRAEPSARPAPSEPMPALRDPREVAPDLRVEVRADGTRVEVVVHTAPTEVSRYADLGPELRASLEQAGFDLASFDARGDRPEHSSSSPRQTAETNGPSKGPRGRIQPTRGGRYA